MELLFFVLLLISVVNAVPPPVPGAGVVERELEKEYEPQVLQPRKEVPAIQIDIPEERLEMPEGVSFRVHEVEIVGNKSVSSQKIQGWIQEYLGRQLSLKDIYALCEKIDAGYAKEGYFLARAYPPPQRIKSSKLVIEIIEGRLGKIKVEGNQHYSSAFIESYFRKLQGGSLRYDSFMRALLLLNENSDLNAGALFAKGEKLGTADVIIRVDDKRPLHLYLNANNLGRDLTTNWRAGGRIDAGNLFTNGDTFSVAEVIGFPVDALYFTDVIYKIPLNRNGARMEVSYLYSAFNIEQQLNLGLKGRSAIGTIKFTEAISRTRIMSVDFFQWFDYMQIRNYTLGQTTSFDRLRVLRFGAIVDRYASKGGRDYLNIRASQGIPDIIDGMSPVDPQCSRTGAGGLFTKFNADYDHIQNFNKDISLYIHASGQWSPYRLAIPEQIYIGGADTVRGYSLASAIGDCGYYCNFEIRACPPFIGNSHPFSSKRTWREMLQLVGFIDQGGVYQKGGPTNYETGAGFGIRFKGPWTLTLSLDVGYPLVHPNLSTGAFTYIKITSQPF